MCEHLCKTDTAAAIHCLCVIASASCLLQLPVPPEALMVYE